MVKLLVAINILLVIAVIGSTASKLPKNIKNDAITPEKIEESLKSKNVQAEVMTPEKVKELLKQYPNAIPLERVLESAPNGRAPYWEFKYYIGERVLGDDLSAYDLAHADWGYPEDMQLVYDYPKRGQIGDIVSYITIRVRQSTDDNKAWLIGGGPGFRYVRLVVEAYQTTWMTYEINLWGYDI